MVPCTHPCISGRPEQIPIHNSGVLFQSRDSWLCARKAVEAREQGPVDGRAAWDLRAAFRPLPGPRHGGRRDRLWQHDGCPRQTQTCIWKQTRHTTHTTNILVLVSATHQKVCQEWGKRRQDLSWKTSIFIWPKLWGALQVIFTAEHDWLNNIIPYDFDFLVRMRMHHRQQQRRQKNLRLRYRKPTVNQRRRKRPLKQVPSTSVPPAPRPSQTRPKSWSWQRVVQQHLKQQRRLLPHRTETAEH